MSNILHDLGADSGRMTPRLNEDSLILNNEYQNNYKKTLIIGKQISGSSVSLKDYH